MMLQLRHWQIFALLLSTFFSMTRQMLGEDLPTVKEVLDNLRANEKLYDNYEIELTQHYRRLVAPDPNVDEPNDPLAEADEPIEFLVDKSRIVVQGDFFYLNYTRTYAREGKQKIHSRRMGYDGQVTRSVTETTNGEFHGELEHGQARNHLVLYPHLFLMAGWFVDGPLSTFLSVRDEDGTEPICTIEGRERVGAVDCIKVRLDRMAGEKVSSTTYLWLAPARNYHPTKVVAYHPRLSVVFPVEESEVREWREIAPGKWFPISGLVTVNHAEDFAKNKLRIDQVRQVTVDKIALNPQYDIGLFRDIPIPDGASVSVMKDGEVVETYKQGDEKSDQSRE